MEEEGSQREECIIYIVRDKERECFRDREREHKPMIP